jgi:hypothetical protein
LENVLAAVATAALQNSIQTLIFEIVVSPTIALVYMFQGEVDPGMMFGQAPDPASDQPHVPLDDLDLFLRGARNI